VKVPSVWAIIRYEGVRGAGIYQWQKMILDETSSRKRYSRIQHLCVPVRPKGKNSIVCGYGLNRYQKNYEEP